MTTNAILTISDLWLDANQGETFDGLAFGYIGTDEPATDEDGDDCEYCGWFFNWPGNRPGVSTTEERQSVIDSLETDETARHLPRIPLEIAEAKLTAYLDRKYPIG